MSAEGTLPVGSYPPNSFGLQDVHGNVAEWVADCYVEIAYLRASERTEMKGGWQDNCARVVRGGSWRDRPDYVRVSARDWSLPDKRSKFIGFRLSTTY